MPASQRPHFQQLQYAFAAHIRDPERQPAPGDVDDRRMKIYRELFYNNIESFLSNGFPVLRSLLADEDWHAMVRDFFVRHRCHTPYFLEISQEFLRYLQNERPQCTDDMPFLLELAHYEWLELAVDVDPDEIPLTGYDADGDLLAEHPVLSPLAHVAMYEYPVHTISASHRPEAPGATPVCLVVYRDRYDQVRFMEINPSTVLLLELLQQEPALAGAAALHQVALQLQHPDPHQVLAAGRDTLAKLRQAGIVLGTVPASA